MTRFMASDGLRLFLAGEFTDVDVFHGCFQRMNFHAAPQYFVFPVFCLQVNLRPGLPEVAGGADPVLPVAGLSGKGFPF